MFFSIAPNYPIFGASGKPGAVHNDSFFEGQIAQTDRDIHIQQIDRTISKAEKERVQIEQQISQLAEQLTSQKAIEYFAKHFRKNIDQLSYEQKCLLVKICVKKVEVQDTDDELIITVFFAFAQPHKAKNQSEVEPKNPLSETERDNFGQLSQLHGAEFGKGYIWLQAHEKIVIGINGKRFRVPETGKVYFMSIQPEFAKLAA